MKYIDAATASEKISDKLNIPLNDLCDIVAEIPSEDVQPVKHGRWILSDDKYWLTCSFCGADIDVSCGAPFFYVDNDEVSHINFCPNCGARMDGDSE